MSVRLQGKGLALIVLLLVHSVLSSPLVRRDLSGIAQAAVVESDPSAQSELLGEDVFGGQAGEGTGAREKRLLKLKALGLGAGLKAAGAGLKAAGAGVKAIGVTAAKAVGKKAVKAAVTVGATVAKAAITVGIAKLLLSLVFGKINQLIDFKTRLLGSKGGLLGSSNLSGGSSHASPSPTVQAEADVSFGDVAATTEAVQGYTYGPPLLQQQEYLPEIDPEKVSLQVPGEIIEGGFNVVNKAAPVIGEVIQRTAERVVRLVGGLKPILGSSVGFKTYKRDVSTEAPLEINSEEKTE